MSQPKYNTYDEIFAKLKAQGNAEPPIERVAKLECLPIMAIFADIALRNPDPKPEPVDLEKLRREVIADVRK